MNRDAELLQEPPADSRGRDAGSRLAGAGPFQYRPDVVQAVLDCACQVGVAGTNGSQPLDRFIDG
jgi:hypothetical protein